jgi:hypothetical protein
VLEKVSCEKIFGRLASACVARRKKNGGGDEPKQKCPPKRAFLFNQKPEKKSEL